MNTAFYNETRQWSFPFHLADISGSLSRDVANKGDNTYSQEWLMVGFELVVNCGLIDAPERGAIFVKAGTKRPVSKFDRTPCDSTVAVSSETK